MLLETDISKLVGQLALRVRLFRLAVTGTPSFGGLSDRELGVLELLEQVSPLRSDLLASFFIKGNRVSKSTVSKTVNQLLDKKLVSSESWNTDRRKNQFNLTEEGKLFLDVVRKEQEYLYRHIVEALDLTPEEEKTFLKAMPKAIRKFDSWLDWEAIGAKSFSDYGAPGTPTVHKG